MNNPAYHQSPILTTEQALIPEKVKKTLQSRALLDYYHQTQLRRLMEDRSKIDQRLRDMDESKRQTDRNLIDMQRARIDKQIKKNQYSHEYDQMIYDRRSKEEFEKEMSKYQERQLFNEPNWLRDAHEERQIDKMKKMEYGKELENHLKLQEEKRIGQALKIKQLRQKLKKQADQIAKRDHQEMENKYKRRSTFEKRQNQILGVKEALNWSVDTGSKDIDVLEYDRHKQILTPRMDRLLKIQQQKFYSKGLQVQYKSQNQKKYFQKNNPERSKSLNKNPNQSYNPITNPIQYRYKNPVILKLLSSYS